MTENLTACPSSEELRNFLAGRLDVTRTDQLALHVESCASCQKQMEEFDDGDGDASVDEMIDRDNALAFTDESQCGRILEQIAGAKGAAASTALATTANVSDDSKRPHSLGDYQLLERLGQGGIGTVYRARHVAMGTIAAVKILQPHRQADQATIDRFQREMVALGRLDHPNIVRALDAGEEKGQHYLVMEFVDGTDLGRLTNARGSLSVADASEVIRQAALGLGYVHRHGRVHRDVKPSNLMLSKDGTVKLLDLGLARVEEYPMEETVGDADDILGGSTVDLTRTHQVMGTLEYMPPEQASDSHNVDHRADLYSLGCTFYKLLTGHSPFACRSSISALSQLMAHMEAPVPSARQDRADIPADLSELIARMLAKGPDDRPKSAADIAEALAPFASGANLVSLAETIDETTSVSATTPTLIDGTTHPEQSGDGSSESEAQVTKPTRTPTALVGLVAIVLFAICGLFAWTHYFPAQGTLLVEAGSTEVESLIADGMAKLVSDGKTIPLVNGPMEVPAGEYQLVSVGDASLIFLPETIRLKVNQKVIVAVNKRQSIVNGGATIKQGRGGPVPPPPTHDSIDLISLLDQKRDIRRNEWEIVEGGVVAKSRTRSILVFPYAPPDEYRIDFIATRLVDNRALHLGLVAGSERFLVTIDGGGRPRSETGFFFLDGQQIGHRSNDSHPGIQLPVGRPTPVSVAVKRSGRLVTVRMSIAGKSVLDWRGGISRILGDSLYGPPEPGVLFLGNWHVPVRVENMQLTPISGPGRLVSFTDRAKDPVLAAAQRVLWKGGAVSVINDAATRPVSITVVETLSDLPQNPRVTSIDLRASEWFQDDDGSFLANLPDLKELVLDGANVTADFLEKIGTLPSLERMSARDLILSTVPESWGTKLPKLAELDLSGSRVDSLPAEAVASMKSLQSIDLSSATFNDQLLPWLVSTASLEHLDLSNTPIGSEQVASFNQLENLKTLNLSGTRVDQVEPFLGNSFNSLTHLELVDTQLDKPALDRLIEARPDIQVISGHGRLDVLQLVDLKQDASDLGWAIQGDHLKVVSALRSAANQHTAVTLPVFLPPEFELECDFTRLSGTHSPLFQLPLPDGTRVMVGFDHGPKEGEYTIIHGVDGKMERDREASTQGTVAPADESSVTRLKIRVEGKGKTIRISTFRNDQPLAFWEGDRLSLRPRFELEPQHPLYPTIVATAKDANFSILNLELTPLSGETKLTRTASEVIEEELDRTVAEWVIGHGGCVGISNDGGYGSYRQIYSVQDMPVSSFRILEIRDLESITISREWLQRISKLQTLDQISLGYCTYDNHDLRLLLNAPRLRKMYIGRTSLNDRGMVFLSRLKNLTKLGIGGTDVTTAGLAHLSGNQKIVHLVCGSAKLDEGVVEIVGSLTNLQSLYIRAFPLPGTSMQVVEKLKPLAELRLDTVSQLNDYDMKSIARCPVLTTLVLSGGSLGPTAITSLSLLSRLRILNLSNNQIGDDGMARLLAFRMLSELRVGDNEITDAGVEVISNLNALTVLGLAENPGVTDLSVEYLARLSRLRELDLTATSLTAEGLQRLRAQLPRCQILTADSGAVQEAVPQGKAQ